MNIFYPFEWLANFATFDIFSLEKGTHLAEAVNFFFYDSLKILFLIIIITHLMSLMRYYLPIEKLRDFLTKHKFYGLDYFLATIFGAITPFCSCSSIPLFMGFIEARIPLGVTFAFLITSPLINEVAIALFIGMFGVKITLAYIFAGISIGMLGGFVIGQLNLEKYVADFVWQAHSNHKKTKSREISFFQIFKKISSEAFEITRKIIWYVLAGVALGGAIHGFVPQGFFEKYLQKAGWWGVPLAVLLAVPLYSNASGVIPIIQSLVTKGVPIGTALALMMAIVGISLPEAFILKKVLKWQLHTIFFGIVTIGIILIGYVFNAFL
jgi:uncharacterized membrane protein YraQ (UPF0718 family)